MVDKIIQEYSIKCSVIDKFTTFFQRSLYSNQDVLNYCVNRNINKESLERFRIGYDPGVIALQNFIDEEKFDVNLLTELGILTENTDSSYYDKFSKRIIFPILDLKGNPIAFSGRVWKKGDERCKYITSNLSILYQKSLTLYGLYQALSFIKQYNLVVIVEGNIDVISCYSKGLNCIVALCGTAFMEDHLLLLKQFTNRFIFCQDNDSAGDKSISRIHKLVDQRQDIKVGYLSLKDIKCDSELKIKDLDDFVQIYDISLVIDAINQLIEIM